MMKSTVAVCIVLLAVLYTAVAVPTHLHTLKHSTEGHTTFREFSKTGVFRGDNPFSQALQVLEERALIEKYANSVDDDATSLVEVEAQAGVQKVHGFCEICILVMQMKQRGQPHLCAGLNANMYTTVSIFVWVQMETFKGLSPSGVILRYCLVFTVGGC